MAKVIFLTTADVSPWTVPDDWNPWSNSVECIGAGAGGNSGGGTGGGGGGAYSKTRGLALVPGGTAAFQVGTGGAATVAGGDTWFNGATLALSSAAAKGGAVGIGTAGGTGGAASGGIGNTRFSGGVGGATGAPAGSGGGGGAAGLHGVGQTGNAGNGAGSPGGAGDIGFGGIAGAPSGGAGGNGAEFDTTHGSGGGGGGSLAGTGGAGGNYGGAGGAGATGGAGKSGLIVITYEPIAEYSGGWNLNTIIPAKFGKNYTDAGSGSQFAVTLPSPQLYWGWVAQLEYKFAKKIPVTEQPFGGFQPLGRIPTAPTPQGWAGDFRHRFTKKFPVAEQQFSSTRIGQPPTDPEQMFWGYSAVNLVQLPTPAPLLSFSELPLPRQPTVATPQGWQGDFGFKFKRPLSPALQQFIATRIDQPPSRASILFGYASNDAVLLPLEVCYQQFSSVPFDRFPTPETPQGWHAEFDYSFHKPVSVVLQSFLGYQPMGSIPTPATPQGWAPEFGAARVKPLAATQQPLGGFQPRGSIPTVTPTPGGWNVTPTYNFVKRFPVAEQQFSSVPFDRVPTPPTPQGWQTRFDIKFGKRTPVVLNPWLGYFASGNVPTEPTPQGWQGYQPAVFAKRFPVTLQQYEAFQPRGLFGTQAPDVIDPYIYPGDKKSKKERKRLIDEKLPDLGQPYDPRKLSRKQRKRLAELEAKRWEDLTAGPTREEKLHEDMQQAIQEVLDKAEQKRIEDAKVNGIFAAPPPVAIEASLHAAIRVVKELDRQHQLDEARKALARRTQEAIERQATEARDAEQRTLEAKRAVLKAQKAQQDAKLLAKYRMKKRLEASEIHDAVFNLRKPDRLGMNEILEEIIDIARRRK